MERLDLIKEISLNVGYIEGATFLLSVQIEKVESFDVDLRNRMDETLDGIGNARGAISNALNRWINES